MANHLWQSLLLRIIAGVAGLFTLLVTFWLAFLAQQGLASQCEVPFLLLLLRVANMPLPALTAVYLLRISASPHLRGAAFFAAYNWWLAAALTTFPLSNCDSNTFPDGTWAGNGRERRLVRIVEVSAIFVRIIWSQLLVVQRVRALESMALRDFGMQRGSWCAFACCVISGSMPVLWEFDFMSLYMASSLMSAFILPAVASLVGPIVRAWRALDEVEAQAEGAAARRVHLAGRALRWQAVALVGGWLATSFLVVQHSWVRRCRNELLGQEAQEVKSACAGHFSMHHVALSVDEDFNALLAMALSGALSGAAQGARLRARSDKARKQRWQLAVRHWQEARGREEAMWEQWNDKVKELANRGVTLEALLSFHRTLHSAMPHFDPQLHTTANVVHQAIIPLSSAQKSAMAPVLMKGKCTVPDMMVTHNWGNLYVDLVAAVCAHALQEADYANIAQLLVRDPDRLEQWLRCRGRLSCSYWICAFAVNQHLGICAGIDKPQHRDPVTGQLPAPCTCGAERALNDTAPLLPDGRSVPCEMNKFDDMMAHLSSQNANFGQVVAVDASFQLFSRAWCIAEVAKANHAGMVQLIKVQTEEGLSQHEEELKLLRIQDMEAARKEDKDYILQSIGSEEEQEAFNSQIRRLLLEDLIPAWSSLDMADQMALAGCVIRWHCKGLLDRTVQI